MNLLFLFRIETYHTKNAIKFNISEKNPKRFLLQGNFIKLSFTSEKFNVKPKIFQSMLPLQLNHNDQLPFMMNQFINTNTQAYGSRGATVSITTSTIPIRCVPLPVSHAMTHHLSVTPCPALTHGSQSAAECGLSGCPLQVNVHVYLC